MVSKHEALENMEQYRVVERYDAVEDCSLPPTPPTSAFLNKKDEDKEELIN